ncbi:hypothetical protein L6464_14265 [Prevotella communis]|nr:hypothetical protein L6464_14265 [Prevotella communis]
MTKILRGERTASYKAYIQNCFKLCSRSGASCRTLASCILVPVEQMDFTSPLPDDMGGSDREWRNR